MIELPENHVILPCVQYMILVSCKIQYQNVPKRMYQNVPKWYIALRLLFSIIHDYIIATGLISNIYHLAPLSTEHCEFNWNGKSGNRIDSEIMNQFLNHQFLLDFQHFLPRLGKLRVRSLGSWYFLTNSIIPNYIASA